MPTLRAAAVIRAMVLDLLLEDRRSRALRCTALALVVAASSLAGQAAERVDLAPPFVADSGFAWLAYVPPDWPSDDLTGQHSRLVLLEDGVPLGPAHAVHDAVRGTGRGAYSHWLGGLVFSSSDNSDPNRNGRRYSVEQVAPPRVPRVLPLRDPFALLTADVVAWGAAGRPVPPRDGSAPGPRAPTVIWWYTIDALRHDTSRERLPDGTPLMPELDAFRRQAVEFSAAYAQSSFTKTSTASMFTGLWPQRHGVMHGVVPTWPEGGTLVFDLDTRFLSLAEFLADRGYATATHLFTIHVRPGDGMLQGFQRTDLAAGSRTPLDALPERLFAYEHVLGVHGPYAPSAEARARLGSAPPAALDPASLDWFYAPLSDAQAAELREAYRGEALDADRALGERLAWLRESGRWDEALVIVTADHGEEFLEHGATQHSVQLYEEVVRVPLLVKFPAGHPWAARHGESLPQRVRLVDLLPTLAELVGGDGPALPYAVDGASLGPILEDREIDPFARDVRLRVSFTTEVEGRRDSALFVTDAIVSGRLKAHFGWRIRSSQDPAHRPFRQGDVLAELFDLGADPAEAADLSGARPEALDDLFRRLQRSFVPLLPPGVPVPDAAAPDTEHDPALLQRLRELGYLR